MDSQFPGDGVPRYITVEGPIGVGKTSLTKKLARTLGYGTLLERSSNNPFLERFYANHRQAALPTQLFFLFDRAQQINELRQGDMFNPIRVADFLIEKDRLFAQLNLDPDELVLYENIYDHLTIDAPPPDLVIYLQAPPKVLMQRVAGRGIPAEQHIDIEYLSLLSDAYARFFHSYNSAPLLIVNAADIDPVNNENHYHELVEYLLQIRRGRHYLNPSPSIF